MKMVKLPLTPKVLIQKLIRFYQRWISLDRGVLKGLGVKVCRFEPSCSEYAYQSLEKYGIVKGGFMSIWRIIRCNPFSKGGCDPVK